MKKIKITITFVFGTLFLGYAQWEKKNIFTNSTLTCVDFLTDSIGYVAGGNKIYKTNNGGDNWVICHAANDLVIYEDIFIIDNANIIAVGKDLNSNQSVISKTENGGADWKNTNVSSSSFLTSVFFVSSEIGYCSGGGGTILKTADSGNSWQVQNSGTTASLQSIFFINELVGITVGGIPAKSVILKTQDGGLTWNPINSPSKNFLQSVYFTNQDTGYIVGWNGDIIKTTNCGVDWTVQNSVSMTGNLQVIFTDDTTGYIAGGSTGQSLIQKTINGGILWKDISPQISEGLVSIEFPSTNIGYAVGSNGTVVKTVTGGSITSANNFQLSNKFIVFPNPTSGLLNIKSETNMLINQLIIYDSNGKTINEMTPISTNCQIDLSYLESNIYYLMIITEYTKEIKKIITR